MKIRSASFWLLSVVLASSCGSSSVGLDTTFGASGYVVTDFSGGDDEVFALAEQSDGKIIAVGRSRNGSTYDFAIARYTSAGVLDTTFNTTGKQVIDFNSRDDAAYGVAVQSDGKILVAGTSASGGNSAMAVLRLSTTGALDTTFGTSGKTTLESGGNPTDGRAMALLSDGRILIAGSVTGSKAEFAVARFSTAGAIDTTFGSSGTAKLAVGSVEDRIYAIAVKSDGRILVGGSSTVATNNPNLALAQFSAEGALDTSFGSSGKLTIDVPEIDSAASSSSKRSDVVYAITLSANGRLLVAGDSNASAGRYGVVVRLSDTGQFDTTYGTNGYLRIGTDFLLSGSASPVNGEQWVVGRLTSGSRTAPAIARAGGTGALVNYNTSGVITVDPGVNSSASATYISSGAKVVAGGYTTGSGRDFLLFRYSY